MHVFRVLKPGIHLMRAGRLEADLRLFLDDETTVPYLGDFIAQKQRDGERASVPDPESSQYPSDVVTLRAALEAAQSTSPLPEAPARERTTRLRDPRQARPMNPDPRSRRGHEIKSTGWHWTSRRTASEHEQESPD